MLLSASTSLDGFQVPDLSLPNLTGEHLTLSTYAQGRPLLVTFAANHCPYVKHLEVALGELAADFGEEALAILAISSNDVGSYPGDDAAGLQSQARRANWNFPYLIDTDQTAAHTFGAVCTPDFFLFGGDGVLAYRGAFDRSSPGNEEPNDGCLMRDAISALLAGESVAAPEKAAMGCSIKWKTSESFESEPTNDGPS